MIGRGSVWYERSHSSEVWRAVKDMWSGSAKATASIKLRVGIEGGGVVEGKLWDE